VIGGQHGSRRLSNVGSATSTIAISLVLAMFVGFGWTVVRKKLYASSVDRVLNTSVEWLAWQSMVGDLDEATRLNIAMTQTKVLKYSYSAGLSPQVAADTMLTAMSEHEVLISIRN
jgi:hypothetical protein